MVGGGRMGWFNTSYPERFKKKLLEYKGRSHFKNKVEGSCWGEGEKNPTLTQYTKRLKEYKQDSFSGIIFNTIH